MRVEIKFTNGRFIILNNVRKVKASKAANGDNVVHFYLGDDNWKSVYTSYVKRMDIFEPTPSWNNQNYVN